MISRSLLFLLLVSNLTGSASAAAAADEIQLAPIEIRASHSFVPPSYRDTPLPSYPAVARAQGLEGVVVVTALVGTSGRVVEASVSASSGAQTLDDAALAAVKRWTFQPGRQGLRAVESVVEVPVRFALGAR